MNTGWTMTTWRRLALLVAAVALLSGVVGKGGGHSPFAPPTPAAAAFPGKNGLIVFDSNRVTPGNPEGDYEIYTMKPNGTQLRQLTKNAATDGGPAWSPNGKQIAFVSVRDGNAEIYVMRPDGTGQTNLTKVGGADLAPAWSPDGKQIAFASDRAGNREVYTMRADGTNPTNLTNTAKDDDSADWQKAPKKKKKSGRR